MTNPADSALTLFERALGLEPAERLRFLEEACGGDAALLARVRVMLRADENAHRLLDRPPGALLAELSQQRDGWEGRVFGPYRLLREIGRGGMGFVHLAERTDVGARVALKLVASSIGSPERSARFEYERRVLARLDHPHIARFLDAGVSQDGTLWLAMEYVEGSPIDAHCDARCLGVAERLMLLEQVADAVAHAHQSLLVHRDLKPSNILVSDAGIPKLVDFGIAKLLGDGAADDALTMDAASGPMTPEYASPEQVRGDAITTASDVYQLGIVLHELVTGRRPTRVDGEPLRHFDRAAGMPMVRPSSLVTAEVRPQQLAAGLSTRTARELSALRGATPRQLRRRLAGDLDTIFEKALEPQPARRYASARELADELRRHLAGHPVNARAGSVAYRAGKFIRRHAIAAALASAIVVLAAMSAIALLLQSRRVALERDRAEQVSRVLERLVRYGGPTASGRDSAVGRVMLNDVATEGRARLAAEPEVWARILVPVGDVYAQMGQVDTAMLLWTAVIAALERRVDADHPVLLEALGSLGVTRVVQGDVAGGLAMLERMLVDARSLAVDRRAQLANSLSYAGFGRQVGGDDAGARRLYEESLQLLRSLPDSGEATYDRTLINLGYLEDRQGDPAAAEVLFRQVLARRAARDGPESGGTMNAMASLARVLLARGAVEEAEPLADTLLAVRHRFFDPPHSLLADALALRASVLIARRRPAEAEATAREAVRMFREIYGDAHLQVAFAQANVVEAVAQQDRADEAAALQRDLVAHYRRAAGDRHPATLATTVRLAELERTVGNTAEAERLYYQALPELELLTPGRPGLARPLTGLGTLLAEAGRCVEAGPYLRRGLQVADPRSLDEANWLAQARALLEQCEHLPKRDRSSEVGTTFAGALQNRTPPDRRTAMSQHLALTWHHRKREDFGGFRNALRTRVYAGLQAATSADRARCFEVCFFSSAF